MTRSLRAKVNKLVREASNVQAFIVLNKKKLHVATVQIHTTASTARVDIWHMVGEQPLQQGKASGYGFDKKAQALGGLMVDGITIYGDCVTDNKTKAFLKRFVKARGLPKFSLAHWEALAEKRGMRFANIYGSVFYISGLERLEAFGYTVIQAI